MSPRRHRSRRLVAVLAAGAATLGTASLAVTTQSASAAPDRGGLAPATRVKDLPAGADSSVLGARPTGIPAKGRYGFLLRLDATSTGRAFDVAEARGTTASAKAAGRSQLSRVTAAQNSVIGRLPAKTPVIYRTHSVLAGVAVRTDVKNYDAIASIPGVAAVYPITPKSHQNDYAVPLQGAPAAWEGTGDAGQGTTIGIIDTGIDYTHANFGGQGTTAAYDAEQARADDATLWTGSAFPTDKVIGGYDLVGDSYQADPYSPGYQPVPHPDPNPLDCEGHGSHVAGSAAGLGENADGSTYTGLYDTGTPFGDMRIGPGMAPRAKLLGFRVFGCEGSTDVVTSAIDKAADPNGDGDTSDAVDVINMSLGSDFGSPDDADAVAANAASDLGITMAISSGNSYDLYDVGGSPGSARKAITVAASLDAQSITDGVNVSIDGAADDQYAASRSIAYDWDSKPDLQGTIAIPAGNTTGCDPFAGADAAAINGKVALLTWTDDDLECGSVARSGNVAAAGGVGFVFASNKEAFSAGITGSAAIPGVLIAQSGGQAIRAAVAGGDTVRINGTEKNAITQTFPDDDDKMTDFSSRGPRGNGGLKPDVSAVGGTVFSTSVGTGSEGETESGTSMAAPMVAGLSALVVSKHPDWTPEQVKADIMNTAGQDLYVGGSADTSSDRYAPNRVGSGRIETVPALENDVLAYVVDDPGAVSVSFGPLEVTAPTTLTKTVKVQNTGLSTRTYDLSYDEITTIPGVSYSVTPASVTLSARSSKTVTVTLSIPDPSALTKTVDATHGRGDADLPYETLADASGNLLLTPASGSAPQLRVPVYSAPRPASVMTQAASVKLTGGAGKVALTGQDLDQGTGDENVTSLAAGLELQATSPAAPACSATVTDLCIGVPADKGADLKYVGVTSDAPYYETPTDGQAYFGITTHGVHSTAAGKVEFDVYIDVDRDGESDVVAYSTRIPDTDAFVVNLVNLTTGAVIDTELTNNRLGDVDTAIFDSDTLLMPVWLSKLVPFGLSASSPRVNYAVASYSPAAGIDEVGFGPNGPNGTLSADLIEPGVLVSGDGITDDAGGTNTPYGPVVEDAAGTQLDVVRDAASYQADKGKGLMMVHFHNKAGNKTQIVALKSTPTVSLAASPASVVRGNPVTLSVTVKAAAGDLAPTGQVKAVDAANKVLATGTLAANGTAKLTWKPTKPGTYAVRATYAGDANTNAATSAAQTVKVSKAASKVGLSLSPKSGKVGKKATATVTVSTVAGIKATGKVVLKNGSKTVATGKVTGGKATLKFTPKKAGKLKLQAVYAGDATYNSGKSRTVTYTVKKK